MRKLFLIIALFFTFNSLEAQKVQEIDPTLYGYWINMDSEVLIIQPNNTFTRRNGSEIISQGKLLVKDGELLVIRTDVETEYSLGFVVREDIFVVAKPDSSQAWVFTRL
jgi:hypothetical protein